MIADLSEELIEKVKQARAAKTPLHIRGNGSRAGILSRDGEGEVLSLSDHAGIVEYEPTELVMTARAGTCMSEIEELLDDNGQVLPCEVPHFGEKATIGGTLACNLSGPSRPWSGSIRDLTLGVRLINGVGDHLRFGGKVMKNVAGYDASRLQAGALGCLGVITEVSFKVLPKPERTETLVFVCEQYEAIHRMNRMAGEAKPISGALWVDGHLYVRLSGVDNAVSAAMQQWGGDHPHDDATFWQKVREQTHEFFSGDDPLWRFSVKSNAAPLHMAGAQMIDWGGAQRWVRGAHVLADMEKVAEAASGHVTLFRGGDRKGEVRHSLPEYQKALQNRLKQSFDPDRIFNPGFLYSWM